MGLVCTQYRAIPSTILKRLRGHVEKVEWVYLSLGTARGQLRRWREERNSGKGSRQDRKYTVEQEAGERAGMGVERLTGHGPETLRTTGYCGTTVLATVVFMVAALP